MQNQSKDKSIKEQTIDVVKVFADKCSHIDKKKEWPSGKWANVWGGNSENNESTEKTNISA